MESKSINSPSKSYAFTLMKKSNQNSKRPRQSRTAQGKRFVDLVFGEVTHAHPKRSPQLRGPSRLHGFECGHRGIHGQVQLDFFEGASVAPCLQDASAQTFPAHQFRLITPSMFEWANWAVFGKKSSQRRRFTKVDLFVAHNFGNCKCFAKKIQGDWQMTKTSTIESWFNASA